MMNEQKKQAFLSGVQKELRNELQSDVATTRLGKGETLEERGSEVLDRVLRKSYLVEEYLKGEDRVADSSEEAKMILEKEETVKKVIELMDIQDRGTVAALRDRQGTVAAGISALANTVNNSPKIPYEMLNKMLAEQQRGGEKIDAKLDLNRVAKEMTAREEDSQKQEDDEHMQYEKQAQERAEQMSEERSRKLAQERAKAQKIALTGTAKKPQSKMLRNALIAYGVAGAAVSGLTITTLFFA